jgi:hypothetical protein
MKANRRAFIRRAAMGAAGLAVAGSLPDVLLAKTKNVPAVRDGDLFFKIAVSQFSFASAFWTKQLDPLDFPAKSKELGITGLDYCSMFFADKARDTTWLSELKKRSADAGSYNLRIMIDGEGVLGDLNETNRLKAVEDH